MDSADGWERAEAELGRSNFTAKPRVSAELLPAREQGASTDLNQRPASSAGAALPVTAALGLLAAAAGAGIVTSWFHGAILRRYSIGGFPAGRLSGRPARGCRKRQSMQSTRYRPEKSQAEMAGEAERKRALHRFGEGQTQETTLFGFMRFVTLYAPAIFSAVGGRARVKFMNLPTEIRLASITYSTPRY